MDIRPILSRELLVATRKKSLWGNRGFFAGMLLTIVLSTFAARYYWDRGKVPDQDIMAVVAFQAFLWTLLAHWIVILGVFLGQAAPSIALEKDRHTLDFLLATRLGNAEIVLGKLAACMAMVIAGFAAGLPSMLLLHLLGGIDLRLMLLGYAGLMTTSFFMIALAIWISTDASDVRIAASATVLVWMTWLLGPVVVSTIFTRVGLRLPEFLLTLNAWVLTSSPLGLLFKIAGGVRATRQLLEAVAWMSGLQVAGGALLILWAIARVRSAYRVNVGGDSQTLVARLIRPGWRWRPKPPVGDDPILWREMYTSRAGFLGQAVGLVICLGVYGAVA